MTGSKLKGDSENNNIVALTTEALESQEEKRKADEMLIIRTIRGGDDNGHPTYEVIFSLNLITLCYV